MKPFTPDTSVDAVASDPTHPPVTLLGERHGQVAVTQSVFWLSDGSVEISDDLYSVSHLGTGQRCGNNDLTLDVARRFADALAEIDLDALAKLSAEQRPATLMERGQTLEFLAWAAVDIGPGDFVGSRTFSQVCGHIISGDLVAYGGALNLHGYRVRLADGGETIIGEDDLRFIAPEAKRWKRLLADQEEDRL